MIAIQNERACKMRKWVVGFVLTVIMGLLALPAKAASSFENIGSITEFGETPIGQVIGMAVDDNGKIYASDSRYEDSTNYNRVIIFNADGSEHYQFPVGQGIGPIGINNNKLYISEGNLVKVFDINNNYQQINSYSITSVSYEPMRDMVFDSNDNIYVSVYHKIVKITPDGQVTAHTNNNFGDGYGLAIDEEDNLYLIAQNGYLYRWDINGTHLGTWDYHKDYSYRRGLTYHEGALYLTHSIGSIGFLKISATNGQIMNTFEDDDAYDSSYNARTILVHPTKGKIYTSYWSNDKPSGIWIYKDTGTTTKVSVSSNEITYGEPVTISVSVLANDSDSPSPTGTVTIKDGSTELATLNLVNGQASYTAPSLLTGNRSITAVYSGDTNFPEDILSIAAVVKVNKIYFPTTLQTSNSNIEVGESVTFTANVTGTGPGGETPSGTVMFMDGDELIGTETLVGGTASVDVNNLALGNHTITAVYSGDSIFLESNASIQQNVDKAITVTNVKASPAASVYGESVSFTATVTALNPANGTPTGTVTFSNGVQELDTVQLTDGEASLQVSDLNVGIHTISAVYNGDNLFNTSNDTVQQTVSQANTSTHVTTSKAESVYGEDVTFTATITVESPDSGTPTGTVKFMNGVTELGSANLNSVTASLNVSNLSVGDHTITAEYSGDNSFIASNGYVEQTVEQANTTTQVTTSEELRTYGETVTFTVTVTANAPGNGTPMGEVTFNNGAEVIGTATLSGGTATLSGINSLSVGNHSITVQYDGDSSFLPSSGTVQQSVDKANTTTNVTTSPATITIGDNVTITATVIASGSATETPSGEVTFKNGDTVLGTATISDGTATLDVSNLAVGNYTITADYNGDDLFKSSSGTVTQIVNKAQASVNIVTSQATSVYGESVTFTATVTSVKPNNVTPSGEVLFMAGGEEIGKSVLIDGTSTIEVDTLAVGNHMITAQYGGDSSFLSSSETVDQQVNKSNTKTSVTASKSKTVFGENLTITATITAVAPGTGVPSGSLKFSSDAGSLGTGTLVNGSAFIEVSSLLVGDHTITVEYDGDGSFSQSSGTGEHKVEKADTTAVVTTSQPESVYGENVSFTATVTANTPGSGTPSGDITFKNGAEVLGTVSLSGGMATLSGINSLSVGNHTITVQYDGDSSFMPSSGTVDQMVTAASVTTIVTTTKQTSIYGEDVTFTATVTPVNVDNDPPTGLVTFMNGAEELGKATLTNGIALLNLSSLAVGDHTITAIYSGDHLYSSNSGTVQQSVNKADTLTSVKTSKGISVFGEKVTFTAIVTAVSPGSGTPTGTVTFKRGAEELGIAALDDGEASIEISTLAVGEYTISVQYNGDNSFLTSSDTIDQEVNKSTSTTSMMPTVSTSVYGENVTFTATVHVVPPGSGTPSGVVKFFNDVEELGTATLSDGTATLSGINFLSVGEYTFTAEYSGDSSFLASSGSAEQKVNRASTTTSVTKSVYGDEVTFIATVMVNSPGGGTPSGIVIYMNGAEELGEVTLSGGMAPLIVRDLAPGEHTITAVYSGDSSFMPSSGSVGQKINRASSTTKITTTNSTSVYGESVTFTGTVNADVYSGAVPAGTVTFMLGSAPLGTAVLIGDTATLETNALEVGDYTITAEYSGDNLFLPSSGTVQQTVNEANTTTNVTASKTNVVLGESVTFTAIVTAESPGRGTPSGRVSVLKQAEVLSEVILTSADLGVAEFLIPRGLDVGRNEVFVRYDGDDRFLNSQSEAIVLTVSRPSSGSSTEPSPPSETPQPIQPEHIVSTEGEITIPPSGSGAVSLGESITVTLPEGLSEEEVRLTIEGIVENAGFLSEQGELISEVYEILSNLTGTFSKEITITIVFDPTKLTPEQKASIFYFDEEKREWVEVGGVVEGNKISVTVDHLTKFAVFAINDLEVPKGGKDSSITLTDIRGHWAEDSIVQATTNGIVNGYLDGTFRPNDPVTRSEFTVMLMKGLKLEMHPAELSFIDRHQIGDWATQAISQAIQSGIIHGYKDGSFKPNEHINRTEMAVMIANALNIRTDALTATSLSDDKDIPVWAKGSVEAVRKLGIVSGRGGDKFVPYEKATRAEAITIILKMLEQK